MRICILLLLFTLIHAAEPGVTMSDGTLVTGEVRLVPGGQLRFHDGTNLRDLDPAQVLELRLVPTTEQLIRAFAMPEPGKAMRVESGEPYPMREFAVVVSLRDGVRLRGHLYATAVLVAGPDEDRRVVLPAKHQGQPGQRLDQLVYPSRVVFSADVADHPADPRHVALASGTADEVALVTRDNLAPVSARKAGNAWTIEPLLGVAPYVAVIRGPAIAVGWQGDEPALRARIAAALPDIRDYYEDKRLIAVRPVGADADSPLVDALMLLVRRGPGTDGPRNPWHVEVWRWRCDADDRTRLLLSARGALARGLYRTDAELPTVTADPAWWPQRVAQDTLTVGLDPDANHEQGAAR